MHKSLLDPTSRSFSLSSQPDGKPRVERVTGAEGLRDVGDPGVERGGSAGRALEVAARYTWVCDQDTLEAVYVN
jgi:hypothetical protein